MTDPRVTALRALLDQLLQVPHLSIESDGRLSIGTWVMSNVDDDPTMGTVVRLIDIGGSVFAVIETAPGVRTRYHSSRVDPVTPWDRGPGAVTP
jgi:hypothetical protein